MLLCALSMSCLLKDYSPYVTVFLGCHGRTLLPIRWRAHHRIPRRKSHSHNSLSGVVAQVYAKVDPEILSWRSWAVLSYVDFKYSRYYWSLFNRATCVWSHNLAPYKRSSYPALLQSFDAHNALIRDTVSEGRLLEFHPSQSWGPLCDFLDPGTYRYPGRSFLVSTTVTISWSIIGHCTRKGGVLWGEKWSAYSALQVCA